MYCYLIIPVGTNELINYFASSDADEYSSILFIIFLICLILLAVVCIKNIRNVTKLVNENSYNKLRSGMKLVKFGSLLFFLGEFIIYAMTAAVGTLLALFFFWTVAGPVAVMIYLTLFAIIIIVTFIVSSSYGIGFVIVLKKEKQINVGLSALYIILQLIPLVDVIITAIILSTYGKRIENKN